MDNLRVLSLLLPLLLYGCGNVVEDSAKPEVIEKFTAYFDYFSYKGDDDYYNLEPPLADNEIFNPILPGWYSDPSICTNGEDYFLVTSTFVFFPGVPIFHSKDLVNWRQIGHVLDRESQLDNFIGQGTSGGIFAPTIEYNPYNETYYMITTNVGAGNFFVKTKDPFGSWSDPIYLREVGGIDPSFFFDDDGKAYILNNDEPFGGSTYDGHRAIRIREFDVENDITIGEEKMIVNGGVNIEEKPIWIEAPHLYKKDGRYLLMAAEGGTGPGHSEVVFSSDKPMGDYIPWSENPILTQRHLDDKRPNPITCVGHADLIENKNGDWFAVFLGCRPIKGKFENLGRETFIIPVEWSEDGYPYMTRGNELVPMRIKNDDFKKNSDYQAGNFEKHYQFNNEELDLDWVTLRRDAKELYSLVENPGFLSLKCGEHKSKGRNVPSIILRRLQHHKFESETKMFFNPSTDTDAAGMILYKDESHQYFLSVRKSNQGRRVSLEKITRSSDNQIMSVKAIDSLEDPIYLKITSDGETFNFYYSMEQNQWNLLAEEIDAYFLSTANAGGFTGTLIGMYAEK